MNTKREPKIVGADDVCPVCRTPITDPGRFIGIWDDSLGDGAVLTPAEAEGIEVDWEAEVILTTEIRESLPTPTARMSPNEGDFDGRSPWERSGTLSRLRREL
jgi:hypothetical protein